MTTKQLAEYEERLEATGLHFARSIGAGGNLERLEDVRWAVVITKVMSVTGWRITEDDEEAAVLPLRLMKDQTPEQGDA